LGRGRGGVHRGYLRGPIFLSSRLRKSHPSIVFSSFTGVSGRFDAPFSYVSHAPLPHASSHLLLFYRYREQQHPFHPSLPTCLPVVFLFMRPCPSIHVFSHSLLTLHPSFLFSPSIRPAPCILTPASKLQLQQPPPPLPSRNITLLPSFFSSSINFKSIHVPIACLSLFSSLPAVFVFHLFSFPSLFLPFYLSSSIRPSLPVPTSYLRTPFFNSRM